MIVSLVKLFKADGPYPLGKYDTLRDEYLHQMWREGWANESDGEVDSPTGAFALVINEPADMAEIVDAFGLAPYGTVGFFVLSESDQGFGYVESFDSAREARAYYAELVEAYASWLDQDQSV